MLIDSYKIGRHMDEIGVTQEALADKIGVSRKTMNTYLTSGVVKKDKYIEPIASALGVDVEWLRAEGKQQYQSQSQSKTSKFADAVSINTTSNGEADKDETGSEFQDLLDGQILMTIPLVDQYAYEGYLSGYDDAQFLEELPKHSFIVAKRHKGKYRAFEVRGDSMDNDRRDAICAGDTVVGRSIEKTFWHSKFHLHRFEDYVIVHQEGILTKRVSEHNVEEGLITCVSTNPDKEAYPDLTIQLSEVYEIYNVVSVTQKRGRR